MDQQLFQLPSNINVDESRLITWSINQFHSIKDGYIISFIIEGLSDHILNYFYERPTTVPNYVINEIESQLLKRGLLEDYLEE